MVCNVQFSKVLFWHGVGKYIYVTIVVHSSENQTPLPLVLRGSLWLFPSALVTNGGEKLVREH